jgi:hypothetical protein
VLATILLGSTPAWSLLSDYQMSVTSGTATDMSSGATQIFGNGYDDSQYGAISIGFNFVFDGTTCSSFYPCTNGWMALSSTTSNTLGGAINSAPAYPMLAPFWDDLHTGITNGQMTYKVTGSSPNRVLTVEWYVRHYSSGTSGPYNFQVRLYESSNKIELLYISMATNYTTSATMGIAAGSSNFISITPGSNPFSTTTATNQNVDVSSATISAGTMYVFSPCQSSVTIAGTVAQGGTVAMNNNDSVLTGKTVNRGNSQSFQPYTISMGAQPCNTSTQYYYTITGPNAADYQISPATGSLLATQTNTPTLTFTPSGLGKRNATLQVADAGGFVRSYPLAGIGTTRINWIGNLTQGAPNAIAQSGDTLLKDKIVTRGTSQGFTPISIQNFSTSTASAAPITYSIVDPTGQYSINPTSASITGGQMSTPTITFNANGVGFQPALLMATADGETRTFVLYAYSAAPGGRFTIGNAQIGPGSEIFKNMEVCVGNAFANTQSVTVTNVGVGNFTINAINFYRTDTAYGQGTPAYPLLRDQANNPIPSRDYIISLQPGGPAVGASQLPIIVPQGQSTTIYLTFVGQLPGKRFARAFIATNGQNFSGGDPNNVAVPGMLNFDLFGRANSASLSGAATGGRPGAVLFPDTRAGDSVDVTFSLFNTGVCDLRISKPLLKIFSGDVSEFKLISVFPGATVNGDDYVFAPGTSGTITARFLPTRSGARRATVWLRTNDSTIGITGVTSRGDFYLDLAGNGPTNVR